jgi:Polyketide cyclase / dehydrase and lipid transport
MKLTAKTDIEAPASMVYASLIDHDWWEREVTRRGVEVERPAGSPASGVGAAWRLTVPFRGKVRKLLVRVEEMTPEARLVFAVDGQTVEGSSLIEVLPMSPRRTRLRLSLEVKPKTLSARLFLNTLRLAKGKVQARLEKRVEQLGAQIAAHQGQA